MCSLILPLCLTSVRHLPSKTPQHGFVEAWRKDSYDLLCGMCFSNLQFAPTVLTVWAACQRVGTVRMAMCVTRWTGHAPTDASLGLSLRIAFAMKVSRIALIVLTTMIIMDEPCNVTAMTIVILSVTAMITITTVAAQHQYCPSYDIVCYRVCARWITTSVLPL